MNLIIELNDALQKQLISHFLVYIFLISRNLTTNT